MEQPHAEPTASDEELNLMEDVEHLTRQIGRLGDPVDANLARM